MSLPFLGLAYRPRPAVCVCGHAFMKQSPVHTYCSDRCRARYAHGERVCANPGCRKAFIPQPSKNGLTQYCSRDCYLACARKEA